MPPEMLHWWSGHVQRFLKFVRMHPEEGLVDVLVEHFLANQDVRTPPVVGAMESDLDIRYLAAARRLAWPESGSFVIFVFFVASLAEADLD